MPLYFRPRFHQRIAKPLQFGLAILALLLALSVVGTWLTINYYTNQHQNTPPGEEDPSSDTDEVLYTAADTANLLVILGDGDQPHFVLVQADPADRRIRVVPLPSHLKVDEGVSLMDTLKKSGAARTAAAVAAALEIPVPHYTQFSVAQTESFLDYLGDGVPYTLPQDVRYTDENGATQKLKAGSHTLSALQAASLLRYTDWQDAATGQAATAELVAAVLGKYWVSGRSYSATFAQLSNTCHTDLRISDFTAWRETAEYLAAANSTALSDTGVAIVSRVDLTGSTDANGLYVPQRPASLIE